MSDHAPTPLSPRHERFVLEYLKDNNATQAYIRAGYSARGAQPSASKLLRDPRIAAAVGAGRQRIAEALEVDVTRLAQEYAKIAFANVADYVSTDAAGHLRIDLEKASLAQQAGILELRIGNHRNPEKGQITLKLGKLQALKELTKNIGVLGRKPAPGLTEEDRQRYEERHAADRREVESSNERYWSIQEKLSKAEAALARAQATIQDTCPVMSSEEPGEEAYADTFEDPLDERPEEPETPQPAIVIAWPDELATPGATPQVAAVMPGMPTEPMPDYRPGLYPNAKFTWSGGRDHHLGPDSADALKSMEPGGFPGWEAPRQIKKDAKS